MTVDTNRSRAGERFRAMPITRKGQNRIREADSAIVVVREERENLFGTAGTWLLVTFEGADPKHDRWIHETADSDFILDPRP